MHKMYANVLCIYKLLTKSLFIFLQHSYNRKCLLKYDEQTNLFKKNSNTFLSNKYVKTTLIYKIEPKVQVDFSKTYCPSSVRLSNNVDLRIFIRFFLAIRASVRNGIFGFPKKWSRVTKR